MPPLRSTGPVCVHVLAGGTWDLGFAADGVSRQAPMCRWCIQAHEMDLPWVFVFFAVGIGIGISFGVEIAFGRHFDIDAEGDPDPEISRYQLYLRGRYKLCNRLDWC